MIQSKAERAVSMDEAARFAADFIAREFAAYQAKYLQRDETQARATIARFLELVEDEVESDMVRPIAPVDAWFETGQAMLAGGLLTPRTLFQIKAYRHPELGRLYRLYVSAPSRPRSGGSSYFTNFFAADTDSGLKVIARYDIDLLPDQPGERLQINGLDWIFAGGTSLETLGSLLEVRQFEPPSRSEHLTEYELEG